MSLSKFLSVISGRRVAFFGVLCAFIALAMLITYMLPPQYTAKAQVIVESRGPAPLPQTMATRLATEADLLQSERVAVVALRQLGLNTDAVLLNKWRDTTGGHGDFEAWAADQLLKKLDVKPSRESNILTVSYSSKDSTLAARTVNAFVKAYMDMTNEMRDENAAQSSESFEGRTRNLKAALQLAEQKLTSFQAENGIAFTDEKLDIENLRLAELNAQLVGLQSAAANAAGRQRLASTNRSGMEEVLRDPLVATLSADVARQEARVVELRTRAGEQHPSVTEQRNVLNELKARLDAATVRATSSIPLESRVAQDRAGSIQAALDAQRRKVMQVKAKRDQAQRLQLDLDLARRAYDAGVIRANEAVLDSGASRGNVSVVKPAAVPSKPTFPKPMVNLIASIVMGVLAGVAVAFWRESRDRRLWLDRDVAELLEQPMLGLISNGRTAPAFLRLSGH